MAHFFSPRRVRCPGVLPDRAGIGATYIVEPGCVVWRCSAGAGDVGDLRIVAEKMILREETGGVAVLPFL